MYEIEWLSVWCVQHRHNFGHVLIPRDLDVPPALGQTKITVNREELLEDRFGDYLITSSSSNRKKHSRPQETNENPSIFEWDFPMLSIF